jgi:hypothetical protein
VVSSRKEQYPPLEAVEGADIPTRVLVFRLKWYRGRSLSFATAPLAVELWIYNGRHSSPRTQRWYEKNVHVRTGPFVFGE